jgi:hypothetical protein
MRPCPGCTSLQSRLTSSQQASCIPLTLDWWAFGSANRPDGSFESFPAQAFNIADVSPAAGTIDHCNYWICFALPQNGIEEADGSIPFSSTDRKSATGAALGNWSDAPLALNKDTGGPHLTCREAAVVDREARVPACGSVVTDCVGPLDAAGTRGLQPGDGVSEHLHLVVAKRAEDEQVTGAGRRQQQMQQSEQRGVGPLQVIEKHHERVLRVSEGPKEVLEHDLEAALRFDRAEPGHVGLRADHELELGDRVGAELAPAGSPV